MKKTIFLSICVLLSSYFSTINSRTIDKRNSSILKNNFSYQADEKTNNEQSVLQYLKLIQDKYSANHYLVPAMEDNSGQTFNNALTAMAFILSEEKERAERILDFYAGRTDTTNLVINKQNFFYNHQARGFFQNVDLNNNYNPFISDRWMGDNVWLLLAYKHYEQKYGFSAKPKYQQLVEYLKKLLLNFYIDDPDGHGGFVRHGWRWGPRDSSTPQNDYQLHEFNSQGKPVGHEEGNIDAYAVFKLLGENEKAQKIKEWIDYRMSVLGNTGLPLDLYSWRSLAFYKDGLQYKLLVNVPESDFGFKKVVAFNNKHVVGFFSRDDHSVNNVWLDGTGHMACAFYFAGFPDKGDFYTAQLDSFLIDKTINGVSCSALPYTTNTNGGYNWVDISKGFSSACAWYIFAKHKFNPFTLEIYSSTGIEVDEPLKINYNLEQNYPNPFNPATTIKYTIAKNDYVSLKVYDIVGREVANLVNEYKQAGTYNITFNASLLAHSGEITSGIYFYRLTTPATIISKKMMLVK